MILSNKNLQDIISRTDSGTKLSIYIPTHPSSTSQTLTEDTIRFKNTLQNIKAHEKFDKQELAETMKKLETLVKDSVFWKHRTFGLAIFADKNGYETVDLNYGITDMQYVQDTYVISPLAILLSLGTGYYVLDINHTKPRLVYFASSKKEEIELEDMPGSLEDTIDRDENIQRLQHQSSPKNMYHGQFDSSAIDADMLVYYKQIAGAVDKYLADHDEPLLLTGTENRIGHMRPLLNYAHIIEEVVEGNNEDLNEQQLQDASSDVIKKADIISRDKLVKMVENTSAKGLALASDEIMDAITQGRVETLFLSAFRRTSDNVREGNDETIVLQLPEDITTTESIVRGVFQQGGNVVAVKQGSFDNDEPRALCRY